MHNGLISDGTEATDPILNEVEQTFGISWPTRDSNTSILSLHFTSYSTLYICFWSKMTSDAFMASLTQYRIAFYTNCR